MDALFEGFLTQLVGILHHAKEARAEKGYVESSNTLMSEIPLSILCTELHNACDRARGDFETQRVLLSSPITSQEVRRLTTELAREKSVSAALEKKLEAKSRAVDRVRETLWKECCMLRFDLEERGWKKKISYHANNFEAMVSLSEGKEDDTAPSPEEGLRFTLGMGRSLERGAAVAHHTEEVQALRATFIEEKKKERDKWNDRLVLLCKQHEAEVVDFQRRDVQHVSRIQQLEGILDAISSEKDGVQGTVFALAVKVRDLEAMALEREAELSDARRAAPVGLPEDVAEMLKKAEAERDAAVANVERLVAHTQRCEEENEADRAAAVMANKADQLSMSNAIMEAHQKIRRLQAQVTAVVGRFDTTLYSCLNKNDVGSVVSHPLLASVPEECVACVRAVMAEYADLLLAPRWPPADASTQTDDDSELFTHEPHHLQVTVKKKKPEQSLDEPPQVSGEDEELSTKPSSKNLKKEILMDSHSFRGKKKPDVKLQVKAVFDDDTIGNDAIELSPRHKTKIMNSAESVVNRLKAKREKKPAEEVVAPPRMAALRDTAAREKPEKPSVARTKTFQAVTPPKKTNIVPPQRPAPEKARNSVIALPFFLPSKVGDDHLPDSQIATDLLRHESSENIEGVVPAAWDLHPSAAFTRRLVVMSAATLDSGQQTSVIGGLETSVIGSEVPSPRAHASFRRRTGPHDGKDDPPSLTTTSGSSSAQSFQRGVAPRMGSPQNSFHTDAPRLVPSIALGHPQSPTTCAILEKTANPNMYSSFGEMVGDSFRVKPQGISHMPPLSVAQNSPLLSPKLAKRTVSFTVLNEVPAESEPEHPEVPDTALGTQIDQGTVSPAASFVLKTPDRSYPTTPKTQAPISGFLAFQPGELTMPSDRPPLHNQPTTPSAMPQQGLVPFGTPSWVVTETISSGTQAGPPDPLKLVWSPNPRATPSIQSPRRIQTRALCLVPSTMGTIAPRKTSPAPIPWAPKPPKTTKWRPLPDSDLRFII